MVTRAAARKRSIAGAIAYVELIFAIRIMLLVIIGFCYIVFYMTDEDIKKLIDYVNANRAKYRDQHQSYEAQHLIKAFLIALWLMLVVYTVRAYVAACLLRATDPETDLAELDAIERVEFWLALTFGDKIHSTVHSLVNFDVISWLSTGITISVWHTVLQFYTELKAGGYRRRMMVMAAVQANESHELIQVLDQNQNHNLIRLRQD